jgi:nucleoside-diphosphate-sugar epimerase
MAVCILGANGFLGRNLQQHFGARAHGVTRQELDLEDADAVALFFSNMTFDTVVHCVALGGSRLKPDDPEFYKRNVSTFVNVSAHAHRWRRFVWFSSGAALCAPLTPYGASKITCEALALRIPNCQVKVLLMNTITHTFFQPKRF